MPPTSSIPPINAQTSHSPTFPNTTMPSLNPSPSAAVGDSRLTHLLYTARPFLRDDPSSVPSDPALPSLLSALRSANAGECWHKHGTFLAHLAGVHRILTLWSAPLPVARCGLFHSAYSNSYVNLAIFDPGPASRAALTLLLGPAAERLVHLFCIIPRHTLIHDLLLFQYTDSDLTADLAASADQTRRRRTEPWREKLNSVVPPEGVFLKEIHTGEEVLVSRRAIALFLLITMADFSEQLFGFQDRLFGNENGRLEFAGSDVGGVLWPGDGKPGLWMSSVSRMGAIYNLIVREEEICREEGLVRKDEYEEIDLVVPPVFENCTRVLDGEEVKLSRDLYWEAVVSGGEKKERLLRESVERNGYAGEGWVVLAQVCLGEGRWEEGEEAGEEGLRLMLEWGTGWDKRVSWEGWVAWARVLIGKAREKDWPRTPWGILNLGLVR